MHSSCSPKSRETILLKLQEKFVHEQKDIKLDMANVDELVKHIESFVWNKACQ